jgi:predicted RNA polymerase sigma factor
MATLEATHRAIDAVWRIEAAKVIAGVARMVRDVGLAEELAQDALVAALEHWPKDGVPDNPGAWLMRTAKNRALDRLRQESLHAKKHEELGADLEALQAHVEPDFVDALARRAPTTSATTCCAWCSPPATRARDRGRGRAHPAPARRPRHRRDRARLPRARGDRRAAHRARQAHAGRGQGAVRGARCERAGAAPRSVLEVVYLIFNEGYSATAGDDWMRPALCDEALRLGRVLAGLVPARARCTAWSR